MKTTVVLFHIAVIIFLISCQFVSSRLPGRQTQPAETEQPAAISNEEDSDATEAPFAATATPVADLAPFQAAMTADALTAAARPAIPTSSALSYNVTVPGSACWMNSQVKVYNGQNVRISAFGSVNTLTGNQGSSSGPLGQDAICDVSECPLQGKGYGALIGRIENGKSFYVGTGLDFTATQDGQLYFTVNDTECSDNSGTFSLTITVD